jgi:hypothetical protein
VDVARIDSHDGADSHRHLRVPGHRRRGEHISIHGYRDKYICMQRQRERHICILCVTERHVSIHRYRDKYLCIQRRRHKYRERERQRETDKYDMHFTLNKPLH